MMYLCCALVLLKDIEGEGTAQTTSRGRRRVDRGEKRQDEVLEAVCLIKNVANDYRKIKE